jgi:hypothetical protein
MSLLIWLDPTAICVLGVPFLLTFCTCLYGWDFSLQAGNVVARARGAYAALAVARRTLANQL